MLFLIVFKVYRYFSSAKYVRGGMTLVCQAVVGTWHKKYWSCGLKIEVCCNDIKQVNFLDAAFLFERQSVQLFWTVFELA